MPREVRALILKVIIAAALIWVVQHVYKRTRFFVKKNIVYVPFFFGILMYAVLLLMDSLSPMNPLVFHVLLVLILFGVGMIVRALKLRAVRDHLTGLLTRFFFFEEFLPREMKKMEREGKEMALLIIDIDDFKKINDTFGHKMGDQALRKVAQVVMTSIRGSDIPVRFGGDEILVALPGTGREGAKIVLDRIKERVRDIDFIYPLEVSGGVGVWRKGRDLDEVLEEMDRELYEEKLEKERRT